MKIVTKIMGSGLNEILYVDVDDSTSINDYKNIISSIISIPFNRIMVISNGTFPKGHETFQSLNYNESNFIVCNIRKCPSNESEGKIPTPDVNIDNQKTNPEKNNCPCKEPLPGLEIPKENIEINTDELISQLMGMGISLERASELLIKNNYDIDAAVYEYQTKKLRKRREITNNIEELRRDLTADPNLLERIIRDVEREYPERGAEFRANPESFLLDIKLNPNDFPIEQIKNHTIILETSDENQDEEETQNVNENQNETLEMGQLSESQEEDIATLVNMGYEIDMVRDIYEACGRKLQKTIQILLGE